MSDQDLHYASMPVSRQTKKCPNCGKSIFNLIVMTFEEWVLQDMVDIGEWSTIHVCSCGQQIYITIRVDNNFIHVSTKSAPTDELLGKIIVETYTKLGGNN